ncbi:MAG: M28 family peptidase [Bacteroidales bacterium]|nr:M28 family peptidase [Bacteroidales bacterium]
MRKTLILAACLLALAGCTRKQQPAPGTTRTDYTTIQAPAFDPDSAMAYAAAQVAFGHRVPGSQAWQRCGLWLESQLRRWCDTVVTQPFQCRLWDGSSMPGRNIIGSINPQASQRVLLAAHWDSRSWADHDPQPSLRHNPVPGANDGASGVAVLLEVARAMASMRPSAGIDIIFFDVEDQGVAEWSDIYDEHSWCKGAQYWAETPHVPYYRAVYGVLLDMVGCPEPRFTKEYVSCQFAPGLTDKLWSCAAALGYSNIFVDQKSDPILDDHLYVNEKAGIPMADIVQNSPTTSFFTHWHTTHDDVQSLRRESLEAVGRVVLTTIYADFPPRQQ